MLPGGRSHMEQIILIVHLLVALAIIGLIMLQQGKGADMGASFGAGASQTLFGSSGSGNVLTRATAWLVALFFASSFSLALLANQKSSGVLRRPGPGNTGSGRGRCTRPGAGVAGDRGGSASGSGSAGSRPAAAGPVKDTPKWWNGRHAILRG